MGHAFQHTLMDGLIRYRRMMGDNVHWQTGTDHAGIATQIVVERQLEALQLDRRTLGRETFLEKVWEWKTHSGSTITRQMRRLGSSCDWSRERFTLDDGLSQAVTRVFIQLYKEGLIYRGKRLVNWDPVLQTAVSDLEVVSEEEDGKLWHILYPLVSGQGHLVVATTRPETLLGDQAVAVHPDDERYRHLIGQQVMLPLTGRTLPVIADTYVDPAFGTGCVKITPAHDFNDYQVGQRHGLPLLNVFTPDARINDAAPENYRGLDRQTARERIVADLETQGLLQEVRAHRLMVPRGDRTRAVIEPMLSDQWFVSMSGMADKALQVVNEGKIRFVPDNWKNTYAHWLNHIEDWCISRQLWWGHRIPAWYDEKGQVYVAPTQAEAEKLAGTSRLTRDEDVLDTWFSSALWPFSTLGWPEDTPELQTFLPSQVLVTGFDIIFFWVARMIMMTTHFTGQVPFREVYVTGLVRDAHGQKMSKSKGNILDPIDIIDGIDLESLVKKRTSHLMDPRQARSIENSTRKEFPEGIPSYGTDALRFTFASLATHGRDIKFDMQRCEGYRNFCNKLWNATRYVLMNVEDQDCGLDEKSPVTLSLADHWIIHRLQDTEAAIHEGFKTYRFDLVARHLYEFVWDEYCDWYVELAKCQLADGDEMMQRGTRRTLVRVLEATLRLAHPLIPFITEALWQKVAPLAGKSGPSIMIQPYPVPDDTRRDTASVQSMERLKALVNACRNLRSTMNVNPGERLPLLVGGNVQKLEGLESYLRFMARLSEVTPLRDEQDVATGIPTTIVEDLRLALHIEVDREAERNRLEKQREKLLEEQGRCQAKLSNPGFVERAPANVVAQERERLERFSTSLGELEQQWKRLFEVQ